jgi:hypothetical protein
MMKLSSTAIIVLLATASCSSKEAPKPTGGGAGTVAGLVSDISTGARLSNVTVSDGTHSTTTDAQGEFTLSGLASGTTKLSLTKEGYAPGYANAKVSDTAEATLVSLKKAGTLQTYRPTSSATISQTTEAGPYALIFTPNSLDTSDANLRVSVTPLDPTKEQAALPGSLIAGGASPSVLQPVTFAEFTILDSTGKRVDLKAGASATVELPVPPSLRSQFPLGATMHCYAYSSSTGKWEDFVDGTVVVSSVDGRTPVLKASIRHFSWYGAAPQGTDCADLYGQVVSAVDGKPLGNARVEAFPGTTSYSDANGNFQVISLRQGTSTITAYQTGFDVDGSLTGIKGAKYIEFGKVTDIPLTGLVSRPCSGVGTASSALLGQKTDPVIIRVGLIKSLNYDVTAILVSGGITVILQQGLPGPDGQLTLPMPADGAKITLSTPGGPSIALQGSPGTGAYFATQGVSLVPGALYTLSIDPEGKGSVKGTGSVFAVGQLQWVRPTSGATVSANSLVAEWSDSAAAGNPNYAPIYFVSLSSNTDGASYFGTDRTFTPRSASNPTAPLKPGSYSGTLSGFSGPFTIVGNSQFTETNNITGVGISGKFYSYDASPGGTITFTVN